MLLFSSLTPTAIDYNPNVSATMQQPSSVVYANHKTYNLIIHKEDTEKTQVFNSKYWREIALARTSGVRGGACNEPVIRRGEVSKPLLCV